VTLPVVWPVLFAATALSFALAFEEFPITFFTIGSNSTLPMYVFSRLDMIVDPEVNVVATLLMSVTLGLFAFAAVLIALGRRRASPEPRVLEAS
jgi:spermidine/putrescine transport system permease protein